MSSELGRAAIERFRDWVARRFGLQCDEAKLALFADVLGRRLGATGRDVERYLDELDGPLARDEFRALARELTVHETYFFRHREQLRAFSEVALPERLQACAASRPLRILSAGCASGEEPFSIAMLLHATRADAASRVAILGIDVNAAQLERASRGCYTRWSLRETPAEYRTQWFEPDGAGYVLDPSIRASVAFEERNLVEDNADLWQSGVYDVVFCRNVLMYFENAVARRIVERIHRALAPGGYLFLGHAETLRGLSDEFQLRHSHLAFYYQRKGAQATRARSGSELGARSALAPLPLPAPHASDDAWITAIHGSTRRIQALADARDAAATNALARDAAPAATVVAHAETGEWELGRAFELLRGERFVEALAHVQRAPRARSSDPDVLLLLAVLFVHNGQLPEAAETSRRLLALDGANAGAHYVLALCREDAGDALGASDEDRRATDLDPAFAMPRLHLGLLARKAGDRASAQRDIAHAMALLADESAARVVLFGGGFGREALIGLCRAELAACGDAS